MIIEDKRTIVMDKTAEGEALKKKFVVTLSENGYETRKRESFLKWRDQDVYLVQNEDISGVMFVRAFKEKDDCWGITVELYETFATLVKEDEGSSMFIVLLNFDSSGTFLNGDEFELLRTKVEEDDNGDLSITRAVLKENFAANFFADTDTFLKMLGGKS
jgi:hypothetical protein